MHRRPGLKEAIQVLTTLSTKYSNEDATTALQDYDTLKTTNEFQAARMVVDIVDHYYHAMGSKGLTYV